MAISLDREAVNLLREGVVRVKKGSIKGERKFVVYSDVNFNGHFLKKYNVESMLDQIRDFNDFKDVSNAKCEDLVIKSS